MDKALKKVQKAFAGKAEKLNLRTDQDIVDTVKELRAEIAPWRESECFNDVHPGTFLSGARYREGMTQAELSKRTGILRRYISEIENGKRPIGKSNAHKLAEALEITHVFHWQCEPSSRRRLSDQA